MSDLLELLKEVVRILEAEEKRKESMLVAELKAGDILRKVERNLSF